jgi:gas vesicle protein
MHWHCFLPDLAITKKTIMNSKTKLIIGALAAAALGTVVAGLFATDEGRKTRKKLAKKTRKLRNKTLQQVGELKVGAARRYETAKQAATDLIDEGMEKVSGIAGNASNAGNAGNAK